MAEANAPVHATPSDATTNHAPHTTPDVELKIRPESRLFRQAEEQALSVEQFRLLYARLSELQTRAKLHRVLITSAWQQEGKTHGATNLAVTMAREIDRKILKEQQPEKKEP